MDDYKRLASEWGRKARKEQSRSKRDRLKLIDADEPAGGPPRKKDTKKWCKGKVNREHDGVCKTWAEVEPQTPQQEESRPWRHNYRVLVCRRCHKHLETWYGGKGKDRPDWVDK